MPSKFDGLNDDQLYTALETALGESIHCVDEYRQTPRPGDEHGAAGAGA